MVGLECVLKADFSIGHQTVRGKKGNIMAESTAKKSLTVLNNEATTQEIEEVRQNEDAKHARRKRRSKSRARTISIRRLSKAELNRGRLLYPEVDYWRPKTRGDCKGMDRPCPFVSCKHHLYIDVHPVRGSIKLNFPDTEVWEMKETCALDVADRGGITLEEVGDIMNLTRERVRQVETSGLAKLQSSDVTENLEDFADE